MYRLGPEAGLVAGELFEHHVEDLREGGVGGRTHLIDGQGPAELARERGERRVFEASGGDPVGEGRRVEVDVEREPVGRHPAADVDADRGDLPGW